jgi:AcrR family transcriptional regulator
MSSPVSPRPRSEAKRARIVETAVRHFAERGYDAARVEDMAGELGIAKGSIFQHFGSKDALFLSAYKRAVSMLPRYQDAPEDVRVQGFFSTLRYWLERTEHLVREDWIPYRLTLIGNYGTDLALHRDINRFLATEDPYGLAAFVREGVERAELRRDVDPEMLASVLDWTMERFQDALLSEEMVPAFFTRHDAAPERRQRRIDEFLHVIRAAIGAPATEGGTPRRQARTRGDGRRTPLRRKGKKPR